MTNGRCTVLLCTQFVYYCYASPVFESFFDQQIFQIPSAGTFRFVPNRKLNENFRVWEGGGRFSNPVVSRFSFWALFETSPENRQCNNTQKRFLFVLIFSMFFYFFYRCCNSVRNIIAETCKFSPNIKNTHHCVYYRPYNT